MTTPALAGVVVRLFQKGQIARLGVAADATRRDEPCRIALRVIAAPASSAMSEAFSGPRTS